MIGNSGATTQFTTILNRGTVSQTNNEPTRVRLRFIFKSPLDRSSNGELNNYLTDFILYPTAATKASLVLNSLCLKLLPLNMLSYYTGSYVLMNKSESNTKRPSAENIRLSSLLTRTLTLDKVMIPLSNYDRWKQMNAFI